MSKHFFCPSKGGEIRDYYRSCDIYQRKSFKGRVKPFPLQPLPAVTEPFSRVAEDVDRTFSPPSAEGQKYILILIDIASRFPETIPLKDVEYISAAEALLSIFSWVGIPREILSDRGTQFTLRLMAELHKLPDVKPQFTTLFHPSGNGKVERLQRPFKAVMRNLCSYNPLDWHQYLIKALFTLWEVPSDRTGISAFDLLCGRTVRGSLTILKDLWKDRELKEENRANLHSVIVLRDELAECAQLTSHKADVSTAKHK